MGAPNYVEWAIWSLLRDQCPAMWLGFPIGTGHVFWVHSGDGTDAAGYGDRPDHAFASITYALDSCVDDNNDYIMVIEDFVDTAATITVNKTRVHIIGLADYFRQNTTEPFVALNASGDWPIFTIGVAGNHCEIAGFHLGGGDTHGGIENVAPHGTVQGLHVHDCVFGHSFAQDTPDDGIRIMHNATNIRIVHNIFLGEPGGKGFLRGDGIHWEAPGDPLNGNIENNQFKGLPGVAINFAGIGAATGGITIKDNVISCKDPDGGPAAAGAAITLSANCRGFLVVGNKAGHGQAQTAQNPYLDLATVAPLNTWIENYNGNALVYPA